MKACQSYSEKSSTLEQILPSYFPHICGFHLVAIWCHTPPLHTAHLHPKGHLAMSEDILVVAPRGQDRYWHLSG